MKSRDLQEKPVPHFTRADLRYRQKIYHSERLPFGGQSRSADLPAPDDTSLPYAIRRARDYERSEHAWSRSPEEQFYEEGKILENCTDDYRYPGEVRHYYPTYRALSSAELRGYLGWRSRWRQGTQEKTSLSYAYLYIYELLNQLGCSDTEDGYQKLMSFRRDYGTLDPRICSYLDLWTRDYIIYYQMDPSLLAGRREAVTDHALWKLLHLTEHTDEEIFEAVCSLSGTTIERSVFVRQNRDLFAFVLAGVLKGVEEHYRKHTKRTWTEDYFGAPAHAQALLFYAAVFYDRLRDRTLDYTVDELCQYHCRNGVWTRNYFDTAGVRRNRLGTLLHTIDARLRSIFHDPHPLKVEDGTVPRWLDELISLRAAAWQQELLRRKRREFHPDLSSLSRIRTDADYTMGRLMTDEERDEPVRPAAPDPRPGETAGPPQDGLPTARQAGRTLANALTESSGIPNGSFDTSDIGPESNSPDRAAPESDAASTPLSEDERHYLHCLLDHMDLSWLREQGLLPSILADGINEKLYDHFGDIVLDEDGVIEDYAQELRTLLQ